MSCVPAWMKLQSVKRSRNPGIISRNYSISVIDQFVKLSVKNLGMDWTGLTFDLRMPTKELASAFQDGRCGTELLREEQNSSRCMQLFTIKISVKTGGLYRIQCSSLCILLEFRRYSMHNLP